MSSHEAVVLDEPTEHVDRSTADRVMTELLDALGDRSALVITHDSVQVDGRRLHVEGGTPVAD